MERIVTLSGERRSARVSYSVRRLPVGTTGIADERSGDTLWRQYATRHTTWPLRRRLAYTVLHCYLWLATATVFGGKDHLSDTRQRNCANISRKASSIDAQLRHSGDHDTLSAR